MAPSKAKSPHQHSSSRKATCPVAIQGHFYLPKNEYKFEGVADNIQGGGRGSSDSSGDSSSSSDSSTSASSILQRKMDTGAAC